MMHRFRLWLSTALIRLALRVHPSEHVSIVVALEDHALDEEDLATRGWTRV